MKNYFLIENQESWDWNGEESVCSSIIRVTKFNSLEKAKAGKEGTYDDSLIIEGKLIEGDLDSFA